MLRDMSAEATVVFANACSQAYCAGINQGMSHTEAESYAIGHGRDAEDIFWQQAEADGDDTDED